jgi:2-methylcitrate dehydratase
MEVRSLMVADRLARYARSLSYRRLPPAVVHEAKRRVLDSWACAFGAYDAVPCRIARRIAQSVKISTGATLWGTAHKTLPDLAAFANGALVRYLDFNDTYLSKEPAHPSDNLAAILAAAETAHAGGKRVIEAIVLAYEIQCRLCDAAALRPRGWDHVTYGPFSSALAAGKILRLSAAQMTHAVNLAGVANIALRQTRVGEMSMWKASAFSNATRNGLFAVQLAREGMTGPFPIFEGEKGFMKLVSGPFDLPALGGEGIPAAPFKIADTYIKHYPVEYHAQTAVEAALLLRQELLGVEGPEAWRRIQQIEIASYDVAIEIIGKDEEKWHPRTRETADHSFPYCVAAALLDGTITWRSFGKKRLGDARLLELMQKIRVVRAPDFTGRYPDAMPTRVTVRTDAGKDYTKQVDVPLGHPRNAMSDREVENKFRGLAARHLSAARIQRTIDAVWTLDRCSDVGALVPLLKVGRG